MITCFEDNIVMSCVQIGIPDDMWEAGRSFDIGETVKVKVFLAYWHNSCQLQLTAGVMEEVIKVQIVIN